MKKGTRWKTGFFLFFIFFVSFVSRLVLQEKKGWGPRSLFHFHFHFFLSLSLSLSLSLIQGTFTRFHESSPPLSPSNASPTNRLP